eukprot:CAMPEP_0195529858 /NCGR_PEP_ID=MMETSP0794_2-20130614/32507_1 /TAXON_ID=515487 /ORGANISM="Stephanopyxis turris, Strain CCMP 815" /LENGTH=345 /DNA_ID=CAMNT_0040661233 /DNA_START=38 /DNA_END=1075 /DNA_ORIENTATION=-
MSSSKKPLVVAVVGYTGGVGTCLLAAMKQISLKPFALVRSSTMKINQGVEVPVDYDALGNQVILEATKIGGVPVIADVTASSTVQDQYHPWLSKGISVCTANKGIFAGKEDIYQSLLVASSTSGARLCHETTVGAGLPILGTLASLRASSHQIHKIEGVLSGTLAYVLGAVAGGKMTLSQAVTNAKELGYTEPDPRMDLNGMDVARKAVILARIAGLPAVELDALSIESLVPPALESCSVEDFLSGLSKHDEEFAQKVATVEETPGSRLHYAAKVDLQAEDPKDRVVVGPMACEKTHPFNSAGPDNLIAITTNFYSPRPLVVQGAGAGGDVTATGVLADVLSCQR